MDLRCDVAGCRLPALLEIYYEGHTWSQVCLPHFFTLILRLKLRGWCLAEWLHGLPLVERLWEWWARAG